MESMIHENVYGPPLTFILL